MAAVVVEVRNALAAMLEAADLSQEFTLEESYADWELELKSGNELRVDVVAVTTKQRADLDTRGSYVYSTPIDIAIRKRIAADEQQDDNGRALVAVVDGLMLLTQEIFELVMPERLPEFDDAAWQSTEILVAPDKEMLRKNKQFTSVIRLTFDVHRAIP